MALGRESCHPGEEGNPSAESGTLTRCRLTLVAAGPLPCGQGLMRSGSSALPWRSLWDGCPFPRGKIHPQGVNGSPGLIRGSDFVCKHPRVTGHPQTPVGTPPSSCRIQQRQSQEQDLADVAVVCKSPGATLLQGAVPPAAPSFPRWQRGDFSGV